MRIDKISTDDAPDEETRKFGESVNAHLENPQITHIEHRRARIAALERVLTGRKFVYLDTKYWIYLRDPEVSPNPDAIREIKRMLYEGVAQGKLICPVSFALYIELQALPLERRMETAKIMDDLSLGYCLSAPNDVYGIEITRFFIENARSLNRFKYAILPVWTRIGALFGEPMPPKGMLPVHYELAVGKALFDKLWALSVCQMSQLRDQPQQVESVADEVNQERVRYPRNNQSFNELYCNELLGLMDFNKPVIDSSMKDVAGLVLKPEEIPTSAFSDQFPAHVFVNMLRHATTMKRGQLGIPMQRTETALYAVLRLDEKRLFKPNDANDIRHTAAAMAYCDIFLTERFFASLTSRKEIQDVAPINCRVAWVPADALALIRALN